MRAVQTEFQGGGSGLVEAAGFMPRAVFEIAFLEEAKKSGGFQSGVWVTNDNGVVFSITIWETDDAAWRFAVPRMSLSMIPPGPL